ncbi:ABC transporter [Lachnospiraceae bacterium C10]|nr:ABC transporter [Lachnospiraceae bacterium C10]
MASNDIHVSGIETNNLKGIDVSLKKKSINLIVGPSGSGKSSLAYDTIAQIGQHEYMSMFADDVSEPSYKIKSFDNMVAAVPIKQSNHNNNTRSTIGTYFGLNRCVGYIFASTLGLTEDIFVLNKEGNLCPNCHGIGTVSKLDKNKIINYDLPLKKNPIKCWNVYKSFYCDIIEWFCEKNGIDSSKTFRDLTEREKGLILSGESEEKFSGRYQESRGVGHSRQTKYYGVFNENYKPLIPNKNISDKFYSDKPCPECGGKKYSKELEQYKLCGLSIGDFMMTPFDELKKVLTKISKSNKDKSIVFTLEILERFIDKAIELNLGHLYLHRTIPSLSGGELQRLRMVQVFNTQLSDLLVVLDEPLAGLSGSEKDSIFENVVDLSDRHTLLVVDHSDRFVKVAKNIIALGEGSGSAGGSIIDEKKYLKEQKTDDDFEVPVEDEVINVKVENDAYHYLGTDVEIAKDCMNLITGYSGVGKSTLLREYFPQFFEKYEYVNQKPLMGNSNSSVATALDFSKKISEMFAKQFKKDKKLFSNLTGNDGACPECGGSGFKEFGTDKDLKTRIECQECEGTGFNKILKKYRIGDKNIFDIWKMTIHDGIEYFEKYEKSVAKELVQADEMLLGHLKIGQPTSSLSGGENIRIKVLKPADSKAEVIGIDEPFKGLSRREITQMIRYLEGLRLKGKTVVVIDHTEGVEKYFTRHIEIENKKGILVGKKI